MRRSKKGQSVLEYVIVLTAIVAVVVIAAGNAGPLRAAIQALFTRASGTITNAAARLP